MGYDRFSTGGNAGVPGDGDPVFDFESIYLNSLADVNVPSPTDGLVLTYDTATGKWIATAAGAGADTKTDVYEAGVQVGTTAKAVNFDGADFNVAEEAGYFTVTFAGTGMSAHDMTGAYHTEDATGGVGNVIRATGATAFAWATLAHGDLSDAPTDAHHSETHVLAVTGPHSGTLPLTDLAVGSLGSLIRRGAVDWEELILGTSTYVLKAGATQFDWGQVDYSELTGTQPDPVAHTLAGALHTASSLTVGDAIMADSVSTFSWQTPSYYNSFTTDFAAESLANLNTRTHASLSDAPTDAHHNESHALDAAVHTGTLPLTDLVVGTQGSVIRRGATDWEELILGTTNYALVAGASDAAWAQYDYTWLANIPSTFAPTSHGSSDHTGAIFAGANDSLGAFYLDIDDIAVPADPAVGQRRLFVNTATGELSVRTNASTTVSLEGGGGGITGSGTNYALTRWLAQGSTIEDSTLLENSGGTELYATVGFFIGGDATSPKIVNNADALELWSGTTPTLALTLATDQTATFTGLVTVDGLNPEGDLADSLGTSSLTWLNLYVQDIRDAGGTVVISTDGAGEVDQIGTHTGISTNDFLQWNGTKWIYAAGSGADPNAIHDNVVDEIHQIALKGTPVSADELIIEDSVASWAKKRVTISSLPAGSPSFGSPTGAIDIGDAQADGVSTDSTRSDHQHAFAAPVGGYPQDTANTEVDGTATTPARSDHVHALGAHIHTATAGEGGTITWANALAVAAAGSHDHSDNTKGDAVPEASITFSATGHDHDGTGSENVDYTNLDNIPSDFTPAAHTLAITGPHTGELPWAEMAAGTQGSIIRRGAVDWEELVLSTTNYALVCTATDATWAQYDYTWLANIPSDFTPSTHGSSAHTGAIFAGANDSFGAFYLDIDDIAVPADPAVGQRRIFVNTADGKLSVRTNASTTISLEEQGGGVTWGIPTGDIDIGDAAVEGTSGNATRADHQHAFAAPGAGYPLDTANTEADGSATTPARSDHVHALGAHIHSAAAGEGGTLTWANALAAAAAGDHAHSGNTAGGTLTWANALAVAAAGDHDHSDNTKGNEIPVASLANGTQYQVLRAGATDPAFADEEFTKGGLIGGTIATGYKTIWIAPFACTIVLLRGRQKGGTSTVINARVNGTGQVGTADLTLTTADTSYSTGTLTTTAIASGNFLEIEVVTIGSATEILIQMDITRP